MRKLRQQGSKRTIKDQKRFRMDKEHQRRVGDPKKGSARSGKVGGWSARSDKPKKGRQGQARKGESATSAFKETTLYYS